MLVLSQNYHFTKNCKREETIKYELVNELIGLAAGNRDPKPERPGFKDTRMEGTAGSKAQVYKAR